MLTSVLTNGIESRAAREIDWDRDLDAMQSLIAALLHARPSKLRFPSSLELTFENATGYARALRLWSEGLFAIAAVIFCLVMDCVAVHDTTWSPILWKLLLATPITLLANETVRRIPSPLIREGIVASAVCALATVAVALERTAGSIGTTYALLSVVICALFANVVMRLRFPFAIATTTFLFVEGAACGLLNTSLSQPERAVGFSLSALSMSLTLLAAYSLERDERLTFLLNRCGELKTQQIAATNAELRRLAECDALTGLPNRRLFRSYIEQQWVRSQELSLPLSVIAIDVDHFKRINDTYGHPYGDEVLRRVGTLLGTCLHSQQDLAARCGGEEFMVILPDTDEQGSLIVAERIRALVRATATPPLSPPIAPGGLLTTVSCGVCSYTGNLGVSVDDLLAAADSALYDAKQKGRNCVSTRQLVLTKR